MWSRCRTWFEFIKISHTLFALPFCLIAAIQAMIVTKFSWTRPASGTPALGAPEALTRLGWIVVAFTAARAFAMTLNRVIDSRFDAQNPRTRDRHIPAGVISTESAWRLAAASAIVFAGAAAELNPLCLYLSPAVLAYLAFYSFTKRFTRWSHLVLGGALGLAPLAAETAIRGGVSWPTADLAGAVIFWVAGFDVFYACLDIDFDKSAGLLSLPATIGKVMALRLAMAFHAAAFALFLLYGFLSGLGWIYFGAQIVVLILLIVEHVLVRKDRIDPAFFRLNGILSLVQLGAFVLDTLNRRLF